MLERTSLNGIWLNKYNFSWMSDIAMDTFVVGGIAIKLGQSAGDATQGAQGVDLYMTGVSIFDHPTTPVLDVGLWIEDCDAAYIRGCSFGAIGAHSLKMVSGGYGLHNHFFQNTVFDITKSNHVAYITGGIGSVSEIKFTGCWFSSGGGLQGGSPSANGLRVDATDFRRCEITGCTFINNLGTALYINTAKAQMNICGNSFVNNGLGNVANNKDSIYVAMTAGNDAPVIVGNSCWGVGGTGVSLRTTSGADKLVVVGNRWRSDVSYGVYPKIAFNNDFSTGDRSKIDSEGSLLTKESLRVAPWIEPEVAATGSTTINSSAPVVNITGATVTSRPKVIAASRSPQRSMSRRPQMAPRSSSESWSWTASLRPARQSLRPVTRTLGQPSIRSGI